jgi:uncharacterized protein (TIGR03435 family)
MIDAHLGRQRRRKASMYAVSLGMVFMAQAIAGQTAPAGSAAPQAGNASALLPAFEVVSIKPNRSDGMMSRVMMTPDGLSVSGVPAQMLLREAFGVSMDRLVGAPGWMNSDRFDIEAKVAAEDVPRLRALTPQQRMEMFVPVFEDRFGLKFHHETRDLIQYVLVIAKGGAKLNEAKEGETYANGLKGPDGAAHAGMMRMGRGEMTGQGVALQALAGQLSFQLGGTVIDKTGLTGKYDFDLKWTPDETSGPMVRPPESTQPNSDNAAQPAISAPSIFTALQEQLGLKIESHKEPADVIVIDHIEQPSPN